MIINKIRGLINQKSIVCFFCNIEAPAEDSFVLEYKAIDGNGKVNACPICALTLNDMIEERDETYGE